jgi:hypothetical protein
MLVARQGRLMKLSPKSESENLRIKQFAHGHILLGTKAMHVK